MKIIEPKVELWQQGGDAKAHVARCARVCYGRETGNDEATYMRLINSHHWSMFRHETVYAMIPALAWQGAFGMAINKYIESPYIKWVTCHDYIYVKNKHIEACPNCAFNNYFCHGLLCNIVVLKVIKDEEK